MKYAVLLPEAIVVATAVIVLLLPRLGWMPPGVRRQLALIVTVVLLVAFEIGRAHV